MTHRSYRVSTQVKVKVRPSTMTMASLSAVGTELDKIMIGVLPLDAILGGKRSVRDGKSTPYGPVTVVIYKTSLVTI